MKPLADAADRAREALRHFLVDEQLRLLYLVTSADARLAVLQAVVEAETSAYRTGPFAFIESPFDAQRGWLEPMTELDGEVDSWREEAVRAEPPVLIATLPPPPPPGPHRLSEFAGRLQDVLKVLPSEASAVPVRGFVVVLAPSTITGHDGWVNELGLLASNPQLFRVRFIVVDSSEARAPSLVGELAWRAELVDARPEPSGALAMLCSLLAGMKSAPPGSSAPRLAGMAGPQVAPPKRLRELKPSPEQAQAGLRAAEQPAELAAGEAQQLRVAALSAAEAFHRGRISEAVQHQSLARDLAAKIGLTKEAALLGLGLGAYLVQAGPIDGALAAFDDCIARARELELGEVEAQAQMARGGALQIAGRPFEAAQAYGEGASAAERASSPVLAIECLRLMGQVFAGLKQPQQAQAAWGHALELATGAPRVERLRSSAPHIARELASVYEAHGMRAHAESLRVQAAAWETEVPDPG